MSEPPPECTCSTLPSSLEANTTYGCVDSDGNVVGPCTYSLANSQILPCSVSGVEITTDQFACGGSSSQLVIKAGGDLTINGYTNTSGTNANIIVKEGGSLAITGTGSNKALFDVKGNSIASKIYGNLTLDQKPNISKALQRIIVFSTATITIDGTTYTGIDSTSQSLLDLQSQYPESFVVVDSDIEPESAPSLPSAPKGGFASGVVGIVLLIALANSLVKVP